MSEVYPLSELSKQLAARKAAGSVVVHCHGVFDLLHIGHIRYLQKAKRLGDVLVVTLTADRFVNKGPHRPVFHQEYRADALAALDCVDYVAINEAPTAVTVLEKLQPDIYAKGAEFAENKTPELLQEETTMQKLGGRVEFIADVTSSSSFLLNNYLSPFSRETENYLKQLRETSSPGEILKPLQEARSAKVLVVGEAIIDEYCNCSASGMSSKAPVLVARFENQQRFAGGALAVANHLAGFCDEVTLCAMVGSYSSEEDWLRKQLRENVTAHFIPKPNSPTIVKRRYRESYFGVPLFAVDFLSDRPWAPADENQFLERLQQLTTDRDLIVASDFGHTMLGTKSIGCYVSSPRSWRSIPKPTPRISDTIRSRNIPEPTTSVLLSGEMEIETRERGDIQPPKLQRLAEKLDTQTVSVTVGQAGCLCYDQTQELVQAPSLATQIRDRVGAGDTFFALTALCAYAKSPLEHLAFLGNVAGAEAVNTIGHSLYLEEQTLRRHVESLLK